MSKKIMAVTISPDGAAAKHCFAAALVVPK